MTPDRGAKMIEDVARAIKAKMGELLTATSMPHPAEPRAEDWYVQNTGVLDLTELARAAIAAARPHIERDILQRALSGRFPEDAVGELYEQAEAKLAKRTGEKG